MRGILVVVKLAVDFNIPISRELILNKLKVVARDARHDSHDGFFCRGILIKYEVAMLDGVTRVPVLADAKLLPNLQHAFHVGIVVPKA